MNRVQKIQKAKSYLEMLARQINPMSQIECEDEILKNKDIRECFIFVSNLLDELIANDGNVVKVVEKIPFNIDNVEPTQIAVNDTPISIQSLANNINKQIDVDTMKKFRSLKIKYWLIREGFLSVKQMQVVRNVSELVTTSKSIDAGILSENVLNKKTGEVKTKIKLTKEGQQYIINNLRNILDCDFKMSDLDDVEE